VQPSINFKAAQRCSQYQAIFETPPEDIAAAAVYLSSNEAAYVTGQTIHVNGGMAMF